MNTSESDGRMATFDAESALERARARIRKEASDDVVRCGEPSLFELFSARTLTTLTLAVVAVALVELDGQRNPAPTDALDLALRMLALATSFRAVVAIASAATRHARHRRARGSALVMLDDALVVLAPSGDRAIARANVAGVHGGRTRDGAEELLVFLRPPEPGTALVLPISSTVPAQVAASRIGRWIDELGVPEHRDPSGVPSRAPAADYDRIASGGAQPGEAAVPTSFAWLERGPFAALAFVVILAERSRHLPADVHLGTPVFALATACVLLPAAFLLNGLRRARTMRGAALVCTPSELLVRHAKGIHRAPWTDVSDVRLVTRKSWTLLSGVAVERSLLVERVSHASISFDERLLGWSAPAVRALIDAYCNGHLEASGTPASQGSGGGGGISGTAETTT